MMKTFSAILFLSFSLSPLAQAKCGIVTKIAAPSTQQKMPSLAYTITLETGMGVSQIQTMDLKVLDLAKEALTDHDLYLCSYRENGKRSYRLENNIE